MMNTAIKRMVSPWISIKPAIGRTLGRLFCLPFAGGGATAYHRWPDLLDGIEVARIHLPGREARLREPLFKRLSPLIDTLAMEVKNRIDGPFAIFGHSMGALMAFELSRELRRRFNLLPVHLFVSSYWAPHLPPSESPFSHLPDKGFIDRVVQYGGVPELIVQNEELMEIFLPILRADFEMMEAYVYEEELPLGCPITAFGGLADPKINYEKIVAWKNHTNIKFRSHFFPGGHFFLNESEQLVLTQINSHLRESL